MSAMTAAELLEAAARAICRNSAREGGCLECPLKVDTAYGPGQQACIGIALDQARAALLALLPLLEQPDGEMISAAHRCEFPVVEDIWRAMLAVLRRRVEREGA